MANDGGSLIVTPADYGIFTADPIAQRYLRRFIGTRELVKDLDRWCIWLTKADLAEATKSELIVTRIEEVRAYRSDSPRPATKKLADVPYRFGEVRQPTGDYLAIPSAVGTSRKYFTPAPSNSEIITSNLAFTAPDPDGFLFGILSTSMFISWMRAIGGRIKSDPRFSGYTYNTFPLPHVASAVRSSIVEAASGVMAARSAHPGWSDRPKDFGQWTRLE